MLALAAKALLLGLSTGPFCIGFCFPVAGPILFGRSRQTFGSTAASLGLFLAGRLAAYLLFGLALGLMGDFLSRFPAFKTLIVPALYVGLGLLLMAYGLVTSFPHVGFCRWLGPRFESPACLFFAGFLAGVNLCPPFLLALGSTAEAANPLKGMVFFAVFFLATSVYLVPLVFAGLAARFGSVRVAARVLAVLSGLWFVYLGGRTLFARP